MIQKKKQHFRMLRKEELMKNISFKVVIPQIVLAIVCIVSAVWGIRSTQYLKAESIQKS